MLNMQEAVNTARERAGQADFSSGSTLAESEGAASQKRKILEECTDFTCVGTSAWGAWTCPM